MAGWEYSNQSNYWKSQRYEKVKCYERKYKVKHLAPRYIRTNRPKEVWKCLTGRTSLSKRQGECYATTSMRKVELALEFIFLFGSVLLSRLVRQVTGVSFVVWINTAVAPRQLFCLLKVSLTGFYWSNFSCLAGLANNDCVNSLARTLWAMKGK